LRYENTSPDIGSWNVVRKILKDPKALKTWAIINYEASLPHNIQTQFVDTLMACCLKLGKVLSIALM
jgi:hypothetical protein